MKYFLLHGLDWHRDMDLLDSIFAGLRQYRRLRGGIWVFIMHKRIPDCTGCWRCNVNPTEDEIVLLTDDFS